jgi:hypothetical protein
MSNEAIREGATLSRLISKSASPLITSLFHATWRNLSMPSGCEEPKISPFTGWRIHQLKKHPGGANHWLSCLACVTHSMSVSGR